MQLSILQDPHQDLNSFFGNLGDLRDKNPHVHGLHPYPAKFVPQIPRALIGDLLASRGTVLDPMCGSGTTLVESALAGHHAIGVDINPIATLVSSAKTSVLSDADLDAIRELAAHFVGISDAVVRDPSKLQDLAGGAEPPSFRNREKWFASHVVTELAFLKRQLLGTSSALARRLAKAVFSAIVVGVSNQESETRWAAKSREIAPGQVARRLGLKLFDAVSRLETYRSLEPKPVSVYRADARRLPLSSCSVDLVVTSPPYANAHDYYLYNKLRLFWLEHDVKSVQNAEIGSRNRHSDKGEDFRAYVDAMSSVLAECYRVLRPGGKVVFVVADAVVRGTFYSADEAFRVPADALSFRPLLHYKFAHKSFNASFQAGFGKAFGKQTHVLGWEKVP